MSRGPDIGTLVTRLLEKSAKAASCAITIEHADWERWASATFSGARHCLTLSAPSSETLNSWLAGLSDQSMDLPGHLVADLVVGRVAQASGRTTVDIEILTVEER